MNKKFKKLGCGMPLPLAIRDGVDVDVKPQSFPGFGTWVLATSAGLCDLPREGLESFRYNSFTASRSSSVSTNRRSLE
jgi:hypothetical protein